MVYKLCSTQSAIATCDSYNYKPKLRRKKHPNHPHNLRKFTYSELETATNGFSQNSLLGKGSHGAVYRAVLDAGVLIVAVKRPTISCTLAAENEIEILLRIRSQRIVNLIGYAVSDCLANQAGNNSFLDNKKLLLLVVEYMPNGSLYDLIHTNPKPPTFQTRVRTALQIAKAVRALHLSDPPIIHRDIKSSNVLLDRKHNARLSDFGLALCGQAGDVRVLRTPPAGTMGYLDPCYLTPDDVSSKCDVYSFGILLLEIISGRRAIDVNYSPPSIVEWALPLIKLGNYRLICDRWINPSGIHPTVIKELALLAARCVRSTAEKRPAVAEIILSIETAYKAMKLIHSVPMWRMGHVERSPKPLFEMDGGDHFEEKHVKSSSKQRTRKAKVSNVQSPEDRVGEMVTRVENRTVRSKSKSVGSSREIKMGQVSNNQVTVKLSSVVRLSKSRSMSVLQNSKNNGSYHGHYLVKKNSELNELDELPLLVKSCSTSKSSTPKHVQ